MTTLASRSATSTSASASTTSAFAPGISGTSIASAQAHAHAGLGYIVPVARAFFAFIFVMAGLNHALQPGPLIPLAAQEGVPLASVAVPLAGVLAFVGGVSVLLGYKTRIGAWLLVLFLVPVTFSMHKFWGVTDPMMAQIQWAMFMKNLAMLGGALLIAHFGAGPVSVDARAEPAH